MIPINRKQAGFTLIELLTVMLILVAMASVTIETTSELAFQNRYEVTKDRFEKIKRAIIGNPNQIINGQPNIEGFVKDSGRLPTALEELTSGYCEEIYYANQAACTLAGNTWNTKAYLSSSSSLIDGWGNTWIFTVTGDEITLYSKGKDNLDNGSDYNADYPSTNNIAVVSNDWKVNLNQIQVSANTLYSGTCGSDTCSNPVYTTEIDCSNNGSTWTVPTAKLNCEAGGQTWTYESSNACIKLLRYTQVSIAYTSSDTTINKDGYLNTLSFPNNQVAIGKFIGLVLQGGCLGDITTDDYVSTSPPPESICINKNDAISFTQANCETNGGIWIKDADEEYCDGVIGTNCTGASGSELAGTEYSKFNFNLTPYTTFPTVNW